MKSAIVYAALAAIGVGVLGGASHAQTTIYTSYSDFASALSGSTIQATSPVITCTPSRQNCAAAFTQVVSTPFPGLVLTSDVGTSVNYTIASYYAPTVYPHDFFTEGYDPSVDNHLYITFPFPGTISAFGIDVGTFNGREIDFTTDDGTTYADTAPAGFGATQFIGFTSDTSLSSVTLGLPELGDSWLVDRFYLVSPDAISIPTTTVVSSVPEPLDWTLLLVGFAMTGAMIRRRAANPSNPLSKRPRST